MGGAVLLIDEVLTPDSSRFWPADGTRPGVRRRASTSSPCATISTRNGAPGGGTATRRRRRCRRVVVGDERDRYLDAFRRITGAPLDVARAGGTVSFAREGYVVIAGAAVLAALAFATALGRRSYALWLVAFMLALLTLWVAYFFRDPERPGDGAIGSSFRPPTAESS